GTVAATSFWLFFTLTPREKRVDRFVMAWLAGMAGKEIIVLIGGQAPSVLYGCVGLVLVLNVAAAVVSVVQSGLPVNNGEVKQYRVAWRPLAILTVNTVVIAVVLGLLSGWIGSFHVEWAAANRLAPHLVMPALLVLVGVSLRGDFSTGFVRMARLCAVLCLALAGMAVLEREAAPVASIPYLAVGCQTVFYACTTLAMVRMAETTRYVGLAAVLPYAALIVSGLVAYDRTPLGDDHFSLMIFLSLAAFFTFFVSVKATGVAMPPERRMDLDLAGFFKYHGLSTREQEVSILLAGGLTNSDIAGQLYLSRHTINSHVRNVCEKAGVRNRAELVEVLRECADETREPGVHTPCPMRKTV
ncbi:MAG: helix-turn-helix transcriptional regulator, partial [Planctomycetes bacterium]|nr:helix-turn-helix transcriptional regulator [Planctomycetota bacterium]